MIAASDYLADDQPTVRPAELPPRPRARVLVDANPATPARSRIRWLHWLACRYSADRMERDDPPVSYSRWVFMGRPGKDPLEDFHRTCDRCGGAFVVKNPNRHSATRCAVCRVARARRWKT